MKTETRAAKKTKSLKKTKASLAKPIIEEIKQPLYANSPYRRTSEILPKCSIEIGDPVFIISRNTVSGKPLMLPETST